MRAHANDDFVRAGGGGPNKNRYENELKRPEHDASRAAAIQAGRRVRGGEGALSRREGPGFGRSRLRGFEQEGDVYFVVDAADFERRAVQS